VSYDAADLLNHAKADAGLMTLEEVRARKRRSDEARALLAEVDRANRIESIEERKEALAAIKQRGMELMESTICQKRELEWDSPGVLRSTPRVMRSLLFKRR